MHRRVHVALLSPRLHDVTAADAGAAAAAAAVIMFVCAALPTLDIAEGALNQLIDTYKLLLPQLGGYLTHAGQLNHERLQVGWQQQQQQQQQH
jgi:hypothetical protein